ncbi:MAG: nucleoside deaminase, partial [Thermodesulfobacteriota bacterium]
AYWARIRSITYAAEQSDAAAIGFDDVSIYREIGKEVGKRSIPMRQLLRHEALQTFKGWEEMEDKTCY